MPPKKQTITRRIELEPEQPEVYEPDEEQPTIAPTPKINLITEKKIEKKEEKKGRPSGVKDVKPRKMTMSKLEALAKAQAVRKANIERRKLQQTKPEEIEPQEAEINSTDEIIEKIPERKQFKEKEESVKTYKSKPKRKIVIVKEPESESDESIEIKYIKPKNKSKQRTREPVYDDYESYEERPKENALDLLLKHYGGF